MIEKIRLLEQKSIDILRHEIKNEDYQVEGKTLDSIIDELKLVTHNYHSIEFNPEIKLKTPGKSTFDGENSILIREALPNLTPANAVDERLWVTLSLGHFRSYAEARWSEWPDDQIKKVNYRLEHWFIHNKRAYVRNNAIARLWWYNHFAEKCNSQNSDEILKIFHFNSDYRSNLLERDNLSKIPVVLRAITNLTREKMTSNFKRDEFRNFMKELNFIGGANYLGTFDTPHGEEKLKLILDELYGNEKNTFFK